jgi:uncharacterized membrane protein
MSQTASDDDKELDRHEVRGIFVLGVIGTLLAIWQLPNTVFLKSPRVTLHVIIAILTVFWGLFIFFMAIAISTDWVAKPIVRVTTYIARMMFLLGIGLILAIFAMIGVTHWLGPNYGFVVAAITAGISGFVLSSTQPSKKKTQKVTADVSDTEP